MISEDTLNRKYMPYVSRARAHGGPTLFKAVGPALLTKSWQEHSQEIKRLITERFGESIAADAARKEIAYFISNNAEYRGLLEERAKEVYDTPAV